MRLQRKQVKALLDIMKASPRLDFKNMIIQDNNVYVTDTYSMVVIELVPNVDIEDGIVPFEDVEVWYKLATAKDRMTVDFIYDKIVRPSDYLVPNDLCKVFGQAFDTESSKALSLDLKRFNRVANAVAPNGEVNVAIGLYKIYLFNTMEDNIKGLVLSLNNDFTRENRE